MPYGQKHFESRFTHFYEGFWLPKKFGFDTRRVQFSSLILTKQMTREQAIDELKGESFDQFTLQREVEYVATKLGVAPDEVMRYFNSPNKSYKDYKNQDLLYRSGAIVMKLLGLEVGGKR
jgi:hypothetical protein